jgi:hypothetical protein
MRNERKRRDHRRAQAKAARRRADESTLVRDALGDQTASSESMRRPMLILQSREKKTTSCRIWVSNVSCHLNDAHSPAQVHESAFRDSAAERQIYEIGIRVSGPTHVSLRSAAAGQSGFGSKDEGKRSWQDCKTDAPEFQRKFQSQRSQAGRRAMACAHRDSSE